MPRFKIGKNHRGARTATSEQPPEPARKSKPVQVQSHAIVRKGGKPSIDESLVTQPSGADVPPANRRKIVRDELGEAKVDGGPGPRASDGFDDMVDDPMGDIEDMEAGDAVPRSSLATDDEEDLTAGADEPDDDADIRAMEEAAEAAARAEAEAAAGEGEGEGEGEKETGPGETFEGSKFECPAEGCGFAAVTEAGLKSHIRAKHPAQAGE